MPSKSEKQRRFMGAELGRLRSGKKTETGMSEEKLSDFAAKSMTSEVPVLALIGDYLYKNEGLCRLCGKPRNKGKHVEIEKAASYADDMASFGEPGGGGAT